MTVLTLTVHTEDDPNGATLATLTDDDVESFEMRIAENELGAGKLSIARTHAAVQYLVGGNYIKVTIPIIDTNPIFGFWLNNADDTILGREEESSEVLVRGGPGTLAVLGRALLLDDFYNDPLGGEHRGNADIPGYWTWTAEPYGAILVRLIEEGQFEPGTPLQDVTIDFVRTHDTNGDAWPDIIETIQVDIGTDGLGLYERLVATGNLFVYPEPDLTIHGYGTPPGVDRHSTTFATNKVRFEKGVNIETELVRTDEGRAATHALVKGKDFKYRHVVSPTYTTGRAKWVTIDYPESNDPDLLDAVGARELARQQLISDAMEFAIFPGDSWTQGRYLPFKHFALGDICTVHTGTGASDYNELATRIVAIKAVLNDTSDDATDDLAAKSLTFVIEGTGGPTYGGLGRRTPGVNVPNGCAPCPGDFPYVPNPGREHEFFGHFESLTDGYGGSGGPSVAPSVNTTYLFTGYTSVIILEDGHTYTVHIASATTGGDNPTRIGLVDAADHNIFQNDGIPPGDVVTVGDGTNTLMTVDHEYTNMTGGDIGVYVYAFAGASGHTPKPQITDWWIDSDTWTPIPPTPPSVTQQYPPTNSSMVPDGVEDTDTTPTAYAPGSLHLEMNGSRLEGGGVDFTETSPTTGGYTFTRPPLANAQIVYWYQVGTP